MSTCEFRFFSRVLGQQTSANLLLPDAGEPPFPVLYLLHGLSDDQTGWGRWTRIESYNTLPLIIVMPNGYRGFYTNNHAGPAYATHFAEELPAIIERNFPARTSGAARCVGGLSMGGYGAMRLALGYPGRYVSAHSHSGAFITASRLEGPLFPGEFERIFGPSPRGTNHDLFHLVAEAKKTGPVPHLRLDCGIEDGLITQNRQFHARLNELEIAHEYEEFPGGHDWDYWDRHIRQALRFHARHLGIDNS